MTQSITILEGECSTIEFNHALMVLNNGFNSKLFQFTSGWSFQQPCTIHMCHSIYQSNHSQNQYLVSGKWSICAQFSINQTENSRCLVELLTQANPSRNGKINIHSTVPMTSTKNGVDFKYFIQLHPQIVVLIKSKINNTQLNETLAIFIYFESCVHSMEWNIDGFFGSKAVDLHLFRVK